MRELRWLPRATHGTLTAVRAVLLLEVVHGSSELGVGGGLQRPSAGDSGGRRKLVLIRSGGVGFDTGDPPGLSLSGESFSLVSLFPSIASPIACVPGGCGPGMPVSLTTVFGAPSVGLSLGSGFAVVGENSYGTDFGPGSVLFRGQLSFDAATLPVPDGERVVPLTSPFVLTGSIAAFQNPTADQVSPFQVDVSGSGLARLVLERATRPACINFGPWITRSRIRCPSPRRCCCSAAGRCTGDSAPSTRVRQSL